MLRLGFPANETFREKMRKFLVAFCKLFRENAKCKNFAKCEMRKCEMRKFRENHECYNCNNYFNKCLMKRI